MRSIQRPHAIILGALLVLLLTTSPGGALHTPAPRLPAANASTLPAPRAATPAATAPLATRRVPSPAPPTRTPLVIPTPGAALTPLGQTLDRYLSDLVPAGLFQGSVLVARDGQIILDRGYGFANIARRKPNTSATRFQIASMTKQFTAVAVLQLVARGQLALDNPVCSYLADCPATWRITIAQLLSRSGAQPHRHASSTRPDAATTPGWCRGRDRCCCCAPGTATCETRLCAAWHADREGNRQALRRCTAGGIFGPLGIGPGATLHPARRAKQQPQWRLAARPQHAFAAAFHPPPDPLRRDQALYTDELPPPELRDLMWQPADKYGYGWPWQPRRAAMITTRPHGWLRQRDRAHPDERLTVIVLGNMSAADPEAIAGYLADLVFGSG